MAIIEAKLLVGTLLAAGAVSGRSDGARVIAVGEWYWPVPPWSGYKPEISSGWGSPRAATSATKAHSHAGVDIMYHVKKGEFPAWKAGTHDRSSSGAYLAQPGIPIYAAHGGRVWSTNSTTLGHSLTIDHGSPFTTFYQHLESCAVTKGQAVKAGEFLGVMGYSMADRAQLRHLHFQVGATINGKHQPIDPEPLMLDRKNPWKYLPAWDGVPGHH